jgi:hypothetical protein
MRSLSRSFAMHFLPHAQARAEVRRLQRAGALSPGRTSDPRLSHRRGDLALNFTPGSDNDGENDDNDPLAGCPALQAVVAALAALGAAVGAALRARGRVRSLRHAQTQVAVFSPSPALCGSRGAGFLRHSDVTPDAPDRALTLVCYLNAPRWPARAGGQLRIFAPRGQQGANTAEVLPAGGTVVALRSAVEHEVAPAARTRTAVTCWHVREQDDEVTD